MSWEPGKPSSNENEYFAKRDAEWLRERRAALDAERQAKEKLAQNIKCPRDGAPLVEKDFGGVRVDICTSCRGVWLDAGELEMLAHLPGVELSKVVHHVDTGRG
jgi:hypothetical protein